MTTTPNPITKPTQLGHTSQHIGQQFRFTGKPGPWRPSLTQGCTVVVVSEPSLAGGELVVMVRKIGGSQSECVMVSELS